jgi:hypothetical protein
MGTYRGNVKKVMADAAKIARRLRKGQVTIRQLQKQYRCCYATMIRTVLSQMSLSEWKQRRRKIPARNGIKTRFQKGQVAWNKGMHYNPGGRSVETRFKPGQIRGSAARRYKPVGTVTIRHDSPPKRLRGRKRKEGMPPWQGKPRRYIKTKDAGAPQYCWIPYARYLYEQKYGPLPAGFFVVHKDGDQMHDTIENLKVVDRPGHLPFQRKRDPDFELRRQAASGKAARQRHEANRQIKRLCGPLHNIFECVNCGADYVGRKAPEKCGKCGGGSFVKIRRRQTG